MDPLHILAVLLIIFLIGLSLRIPLAFSLGIAGMATVFIIWPGQSYNMLFQGYFSSLDSSTLLAIPFFMLAGEFMLHGGVAKRLIDVVHAFLGHLPGSLGVVTVVSCLFFAALSGSGPATVAAIGAIMMPAMVADNYDKGFATSLTAVSGALGPIIPPSILFILYGVIAEQSVSDLFLAGIGPGFVVGIALCFYALIISKRKGFGIKHEKVSRREKIRALNNGKWALLLPVIILGGIYSGLTTPTEAAVVACDYALIISVFAYKELNLQSIKACIIRAASTTGYAMVVMGPASAFAKILTFERVPHVLSEMIMNLSSNIIIIMIAINVLLLVAGMFIDPLSGLIIMTPLLLPIATAAGMDPIHFGVILCVNLCVGMCTPPVGANLFIAAAISGETMDKMFKYLIPTLITFIVALTLINIFPQLSVGIVDLFEG